MSSGRPRDERGAITVWVVAVLLGFLITIGLGVDLVGHTQAEQLARSIAAEAARAGAQQHDASTMIPALDPARAEEVAQTYLAASKYSGEVTVSSDSVTVQIETRYQCQFLNLIRVDELPVRVFSVADAQLD